MAVDLAKMENEITESSGLLNTVPAEVQKFAPRSAATMESIQNDIRRTIDELDKHAKRLDEYRQALQVDVDRLRRNCA
jgi:septal ring factor EnvC (AmiA/AmiB activator)